MNLKTITCHSFDEYTTILAEKDIEPNIRTWSVTELIDLIYMSELDCSEYNISNTDYVLVGVEIDNHLFRLLNIRPACINDKSVFIIDAGDVGCGLGTKNLTTLYEFIYDVERSCKSLNIRKSATPILINYDGDLYATEAYTFKEINGVMSLVFNTYSDIRLIRR